MRTWLKIGALGVAMCGLLAGTAVAKEKGGTRDMVPTHRSLSTLFNHYFRSKKENRIHVTVSTDHDVYHVGDTMTLTVEPDHNAHIYVLDEGTSGRPLFLFPNRYQENTFVKAHTKITIPGKHSPWSIKVAGPSGTEEIVVFASTKRMPWSERHRIEEQFKKGATVAKVTTSPRKLVRDLVISHGKVERGQATLRLHIYGPG